jgi:hypothetical protein
MQRDERRTVEHYQITENGCVCNTAVFSYFDRIFETLDRNEGLSRKGICLYAN